MPRTNGKNIRLTNDRRLVCDVIDIARRMPTAPIHRTLDVAELNSIRRQAEPRISWQLIMMRAYALVARDYPQLRQIYAPLPWPYIYEHPESVCLMTMDRMTRSGQRLFFARFCQPENHTLLQLQQQFDEFRRQPINVIKQFKHQIMFAGLPRWLRFVGWRLMTHLMPESRAKLMGTFGMSLSSYRDIKGVFHLGPCTTTLGYDQFCLRGKAFITLTFDHRILDGKPAIDVLKAFNDTLQGQIKNELRMMGAGSCSASQPDSSSSDHESCQVGRSLIPMNQAADRESETKHHARDVA